MELDDLKPFQDDRVSCDDCKHFKVKKWGGRCGAGEVYYVELLHRCSKSVVFLQQLAAAKKPEIQRKVLYKEQNNIWQEGQTPFWE